MYQATKNNKGFTLIELLVVVAIIGLLTSVIIVSLGNGRLKSRDAKRLTDITQIKSGLELYFSTASGYPDPADWTAAQSTNSYLSCNTVQALKVPQDPTYMANPAFAYTYTQGGSTLPGCGGSVYTTYKVQFVTEGTTGIGPAGTYYLSPQGITSTAPF